MEFDLDEEEFIEKAGPEKVVKLTCKIQKEELPGGFNPLSAYSSLRGEYSFLLESAEKEVSAIKQVKDSSITDINSRYSFIGFNPKAVIKIKDRKVNIKNLDNNESLGNIKDVIDDRGYIKEEFDTLDALKEFFPDVETVNFDDTDRQVFEGGLVGFISYDTVEDLWLREGSVKDCKKDQEDIVFILSTKNVVFDHKKDSVKLVFTPIIEDKNPKNVYRKIEDQASVILRDLNKNKRRKTNFEIIDHISDDKEKYKDNVKKVKEHILDGDIYQAVVSRKHKLKVNGDILDFYNKLREINPSPYMYLLEFGNIGIVGSSPETLLSVHKNKVKTNPIAGTCPRGKTPPEDRKLAGEMLSDEKELSEHVMLVDLGRNDVKRVSKPGTTKVDDFMSVVQYSHVQHLESTVSGELKKGKDEFDATRSIFPAGTLTGAPKIRAMEIIDKLEPEYRGVYGGGLGYYSWNKSSDLAITIRTATFEEKDNHKLATIQAGAGIVADSIPEKEFNETERKMDALLKTLKTLEEEKGKKEEVK